MKKKVIESPFYHFYQRYFRCRLLFVAGLLALIIFGVAAGNINPYLYGKIIDFITSGNLASLRKYIAVYFFATVAAAGLGMLEGYLGQILSFVVTNEVKKELFNKIIRIRFKKLDEYTVGELISRLESDACTVVEYYINLATSMVMIIFNLIVSVYFVLAISTALSAVAILFIPVTVMITIIYRKKFRELAKKQKEFSDKYFGFINESFSNIKGVRSYQLEDSISEKFMKFVEKNLKLTKQSAWLENTMSILNKLISTMFTLVIIYVSAVFIFEGKLTIGGMVAFNTYIDKLFNAVSRILDLNMDAQNVAVCLGRIESIQKEPDEVQLSDTDERIFRLPIENIRIDRLSFKYKEQSVLTGLSMHLSRPGFYSIVGENGCGKSTLARLLVRFYDVDEGAILFNGVDQREFSLKYIRENITYIQKEVFITNDSLINNIKLANTDIPDSEIKKVCERVGLTEVAEALPEGYNTKLGENGSFLSSGQKQRINIARALVRNSPVFLLDEVTSDLDGKSEKEIVCLIREMANQSLIIFISHKLTSIVSSDRIFVMQSGVLQAQGTHEQLMAENELYQDLFKQNEEDKKVTV